jgi:hypothetical protein
VDNIHQHRFVLSYRPGYGKIWAGQQTCPANVVLLPRFGEGNATTVTERRPDEFYASKTSGAKKHFFFNENGAARYAFGWKNNICKTPQDALQY